jgi:hypothetical protein
MQAYLRRQIQLIIYKKSLNKMKVIKFKLNRSTTIDNIANLTSNKKILKLTIRKIMSNKKSSHQ